MDTLTIESRINQDVYRLQPVKPVLNLETTSNHFKPTGALEVPAVIIPIVKKSNSIPFIEANTEVTTLYQLENECTTAIFAKDNELTIPHQDFIKATQDCVYEVFGKEEILEPDIRVSHILKGRIPEALRKPVHELLPHLNSTNKCNF